MPLARRASIEQYQSLFLKTEPKLLLLHSGAHPAREAAPATTLKFPLPTSSNPLKPGIFTLEAEIIPSRTEHWSVEPPSLAWKPRCPRRAGRADRPRPRVSPPCKSSGCNPSMVGITPPSLEHLPVPHTIEHIAAECVRILPRYRPQGPYALAGLRADALVALEMGRLLEEEGEKVAFVTLLDASSLFSSPAKPRTSRVLLRPQASSPEKRSAPRFHDRPFANITPAP